MELVGERLGNYVIERPLKRGGMGAVYVAIHPALGKRVAVKFLDAEMHGGELSGRFLDEARITATLQHPNVVDIFDFGSKNGRFYYVMELLRGEDLGDCMARGRFSPEKTVTYLAQICSGLGAAHNRGIVHRDLKPANIFVTSEQPPALKLMDFGVAKILAEDAAKTNYGQLLGTPAYMAPEQAMGDLKRISAKTDLYALGVIAYEMLTGRRPFVHESPMMLLVAHIHEDHPKLLSLAPETPPRLSQLIERCLQKNPAARPESAEDLLRQLASVFTDENARSTSAVAPSTTQESIPPTERAQPGSYEPFSPPAKSTEPAEVETVYEPVEERAARPVIELVKPPATNEHSAATATVALNPPERRQTPESQHAPRNQPSPESALSSRPVALALSAAPPPVSLDETDRNILKKLLQRMKRKGDLPAFVANVGDVNKKADFDGKYSAEQLSQAILKDHALTAKLLRVVNTNYVKRFGGKIYSVQQAIVILGFEAVRSIALSIAVFDKGQSGPTGARVADSALHALVSGELARSLAKQSELKDEEEATVCAMFCNLGRHLALVYLPELYDKVLKRAETQNVSLDRAAELECGLTFRKLGIGVAEQWHLPPQLLEAMSAAPHPSLKLNTKELKLAALAHLSNDICELIALGVSGASDPKLIKLLARHENLIKLEPEILPEVMGQVEESFRTRYASLLGTRSRASRLLAQLPEFSPKSRELQQKADQEREKSQKQPEDQGAKRASRIRDKSRRAVHALALGKQRADNDAEPASLRGEQTDPLSEVRKLLDRGGHSKEALQEALRLLSASLHVHRVVALKASEDQKELIVSGAIGTDTEQLDRELRFDLSGARNSSDVLSKAYFAQKDAIVKDAFSEKAAAQIPRRYYEVLGSPALVVLACQDPQGRAAVLLADFLDPETLPTRESLGRFDELKRLIATAAA